MLGGKAASFTVTLLLACVPVLMGRGYEAGLAQNGRAYQNTRGNASNYYNRDNSRNQQARHNQNFYSGVREGGRGGQYYDSRHANDGYDQRYYNRQRGGIGPGKGALIGGAGGAVIGAVAGGGLKGSLVGGAAGAGIGAVIGEVTQHRRNDRH